MNERINQLAAGVTLGIATLGMAEGVNAAPSAEAVYVERGVPSMVGGIAIECGGVIVVQPDGDIVLDNRPCDSGGSSGGSSSGGGTGGGNSGGNSGGHGGGGGSHTGNAGGSTGNTYVAPAPPSFSELAERSPLAEYCDTNAEQFTWMTAELDSTAAAGFSADPASAEEVTLLSQGQELAAGLVADLEAARGETGGRWIFEKFTPFCEDKYLTSQEYIDLNGGNPDAAGWFNNHLAVNGVPVTTWKWAVDNRAQFNLDISPEQEEALRQFDIAYGQLLATSRPNFDWQAFANGEVTL